MQMVASGAEQQLADADTTLSITVDGVDDEVWWLVW
jgi:hypothetical protein